MAPIYPVRRIFVDRKERMPEFFRNSEKSIRTKTEHEMPWIVGERRKSGLPEIPASDESLHLLGSQDIIPITVTNPQSCNKKETRKDNPKNCPMSLFR